MFGFQRTECTVSTETGVRFDRNTHDDERSETIDLLAHRFRETIEFPDSMRVLDAATLERAVRQAYEAKREELRAAYTV